MAHLKKLIDKMELGTKESLLRKLAIPMVDPENKKELTDKVEVAVEDRGILHMLDLLDKDVLQKVYQKADPEGKPKILKAAMLKRVTEKIGEQKFVDWLKEQDEATMAKIAEALDIESPAKAKAELVKQIHEAVMALGAELVFPVLDADALREVCASADIKVTADHTKLQLVKAIAEGVAEKAEKKEKKAEEKPSEKKPELAKGISVVDLHTHFYVEELRKWCVEKGIKSGANKKDMIKNILAFFEGDETVKKGYKKPAKEKKPKKDSAPKKKRSTKEGAAKETEKEKPAAKKPKEEAAPAPAPAAAAPAKAAEKKAEEKKAEEKKPAAEKKAEEKKPAEEKKAAPAPKKGK